MIKSDHGSPNVSRPKLIGQSERLCCVCFIVKWLPRFSLPAFDDFSTEGKLPISVSIYYFRFSLLLLRIVYYFHLQIASSIAYVCLSSALHRQGAGFHMRN